MDTMDVTTHLILIFFNLLLLFVKQSSSKRCQDNKCDAGYQEVECSVDGEKNRCLPQPHCTPESTVELVENALTCVCDTMRSYWGENYLDCKRKQYPCPELKILDRKSGECINKTAFKEIDGNSAEEGGHPATPGSNLDTDNQGSSSNVSVIAGSSIGAFVFFCLIIGMLVAFCKWRTRSNGHSSHIGRGPENNVTEPLNIDPAPNGTPANGPASPPSESAPADSPNGSGVPVVHNHNHITAENVQIGNNNVFSNGHTVVDQQSPV